MLKLFSYQPKLIASIVFMLSLVLAIVLKEPAILVIPFAWLFLPFAFDYCVNKTEKLFWLLILLIPFSTELQITSSLGLDFPDEPIMLLLTGIAVLKFVHQPRSFPKHLKTAPLFFVVVLMMGWSFLSASYGTNPMLGYKFFLARIWFIIPFVILPQILLDSQERISKMAIYLLVPMFFLAFQTLVRHSFYGFSFELVKKTITPFFRNHVTYSAMLVCLLPVAWVMYQLTPEANAKKVWIKRGIILGLIALVFAYSRGAWLALLVGIGMYYVVQKKWLKQLLIGTVLLLLSITLWLASDYNYMRFAPDHDRTIFHTNIKEHLAATVALKDVSNAERFYRWVAGFNMVVERPITGFGPNSFYNQYKTYTVNRFQTWVSDNPEHSTVHNYFLLTLCEQGFPGLVLFCVLYFGMLLKAQSLYHQFQNQFFSKVALCIALVLSMLGVVNFMSDMIETDKLGSLFWLSLGLLLLLDQKSKEEQTLIS
jgi:O-antigen ligase